MTEHDRFIGYAFAFCYAFLAGSALIALLDVPIRSELETLIGIPFLILFLAAFPILIVLMVYRLFRGAYSRRSIVLWVCVFVLTNFIGATFFFIYDCSRRKLEARKHGQAHHWKLDV